MLHALKERKRTMRSENKRTRCPTLYFSGGYSIPIVLLLVHVRNNSHADYITPTLVFNDRYIEMLFSLSASHRYKISCASATEYVNTYCIPLAVIKTFCSNVADPDSLYTVHTRIRIGSFRRLKN